jgi:cell division protein FtsL
MTEKFQVIVDIIHKIAMIILVIFLIGAMWQMNQRMLNLTSEIHQSYLSLDAIKLLIKNSWWF